MLPGQRGTEILRVSDVEWKYISKELHDLLVKELSKQKGNK